MLLANWFEVMGGINLKPLTQQPSILEALHETTNRQIFIALNPKPENRKQQDVLNPQSTAHIESLRSRSGGSHSQHQNLKASS